MKMRAFLILLVLTGLSACQLTDHPEVFIMNKYAIVNVSIVDVEHGKIIPAQTVIIAGKAIAHIEAFKKNGKYPGATIIDGTGLFLVPGLVDAHVHYYDAPVFGRALIANGVLLVRDMGMPNDYILPLRDKLNSGEVLGPDMVATGSILDGYPPIIPLTSIGISTPETGRAAVRNQYQLGVDMIKVYSALDKEVLIAIIQEAQRIGIKVVGHVPDRVYLEDAVAAGMSSIEHWFGFQKVIVKLLGEPVNLGPGWMSSDAIYLTRLSEVDPQALQLFYQRLRSSGVVVVPTIVTFKNWPNIQTLNHESMLHGEYISNQLFEIWKTQWVGQTEIPDIIWQSWAQMVKQMNDAGIPLMVGTDLMCPGLIPGYSVHEEMVIWQEAGIPPADILRSATLVPAKFLNRENFSGSIQEGKTASVFLVNANPLEDIRNAQKIVGVFLKGKYFNCQELDRLLTEARELAKNESPR